MGKEKKNQTNILNKKIKYFYTLFKKKMLERNSLAIYFHEETHKYIHININNLFEKVRKKRI